MRKIALSLCLLGVLLASSGCWVTGNTPAEGAFVKSVDQFERLIAPRYARYIEADAKLAKETKTERLKTVKEFRSLIDQRKAHLAKSVKK